MHYAAIPVREPFYKIVYKGDPTKDTERPRTAAMSQSVLTLVPEEGTITECQYK